MKVGHQGVGRLELVRRVDKDRGCVVSWDKLWIGLERSHGSGTDGQEFFAKIVTLQIQVSGGRGGDGIGL